MAALKPRQSATSRFEGLRSTRSAAADQDGKLFHGNLEPIQDFLNIGIAIEVDIRVRVAVARQELSNAQRAGGCLRSQNDGVTPASRDQLNASQDEGAHQDVANLDVGLDQLHYFFPAHLDDLARRAHACRNDASTPGQQGYIAHEVAWPSAP